jgi:hypothetical protein
MVLVGGVNERSDGDRQIVARLTYGEQTFKQARLARLGALGSMGVVVICHVGFA